MATLIVMPRLSPTMEERVLAKWSKKEGDKIVRYAKKSGETIKDLPSISKGD